MIAGGFSTSREHDFDHDTPNICLRCGVIRSDVMGGRADWECIAANNVVSIESWRRAKLAKQAAS